MISSSYGSSSKFGLSLDLKKEVTKLTLDDSQKIATNFKLWNGTLQTVLGKVHGLDRFMLWQYNIEIEKTDLDEARVSPRGRPSNFGTQPNTKS